MGEVLYCETTSHDFTGNFYRVWVKINVHKPLKNAVSLVRDLKRQIYRVKYEQLLDWCAICGHLGHVFKEYGDEIHPKSAFVFKDLRATWAMRIGRGPGENQGRHGGRRGGRSGNNRNSSKGDQGDNRSDEEEDPAVAPLNMVVDDISRKRTERIELWCNSSVPPGQPIVDPKSHELAIVPVGNNLISPPPKRDPKRTRTGTNSKDTRSTAVKNLAGSFERCRRAQRAPFVGTIAVRATP